MTEKSREQKLRRAARRQGMIATKGKPPVSFPSPGWMLIDANTNSVALGGYPVPYCMSLEEAEMYIYEKP